MNIRSLNIFLLMVLVSISLTTIAMGQTSTFVSEHAVAKEGNVAEENITSGIPGPVETLGTSGSDLELTSDSAEGKQQVVGIRFPNVSVPQGATIVDAFIQFVADENQDGDVDITIIGEAADNAALFSETSGDVSSRPHTNASVDWSPFNWDKRDAGPAQRTPGLASIVQEVIDRQGWASGNAIAFIAESNDFPNHRTAENRAADGPVLTILFELCDTEFVSSRAVHKEGNIAEENITGGAPGGVETLGSGSDLELTSDSQEGKQQVVGIRFPDVNVSRGATILEAYIQFESDENQSGQVDITIRGEASDNAALFSKTPGDVTNRQNSNAAVGWSPADWAQGDAGVEQKTPNLASIVQEVLDRPGWWYGNAMAFIASSNDLLNHRTAENGTTNGPILTIVDVKRIISGTVLGFNSQPVAGILVHAFDFNMAGDFMFYTGTTDLNGNYSICVPTGKFRVGTDAGGTDFIDEFYDDVINFNLSSEIVVDAQNDVSNIDFMLDIGGSISGTVLDENNQPVVGIVVHANDFNGDFWVDSATTDAGGNYTIRGLPEGDFWVRTNADGTNLVNEYFDNVTDQNLATPVHVEVLTDTPNIDFALEQGGSISGTVLDEDNRPIRGVVVDAFTKDGDFWINSGATDAHGDYTIPGIPAGEYRVRTNADGTNFVNENYDDEVDHGKSTFVNVTVPNDTPDIDFVLAQGGSISGTVENALPIAGIIVDAFNMAGDFWVNSAITNIDGNYTIPGLPAGNYRVRTDTNDTNYVNENFDNAINHNQATPVNVVVLNDTPNIDFELEHGGSISGTVLDENNQSVSGIYVDAFSFNNSFWVNSAITDAFGNYTIFGLHSGDFRIHTDASGTGLVNEYFDNVVGFNLATPVNVIPLNNTPNIDFALDLFVNNANEAQPIVSNEESVNANEELQELPRKPSGNTGGRGHMSGRIDKNVGSMFLKARNK